MSKTTLHTERLTLQVVTPKIYRRVLSLEDGQAMDFFGFSSLDELEKEKRRLESGLETYNKSFVNFQLIENKSGTIIGWCGYHTWYTDHDRAEIGYNLVSDEYKRKGYMTEALSPIIDYGFREMNLHRIEAFASPTNLPSIKLLTSQNFEKEGLLKEHYLKDGVYEDSAVYALLRPNTTKTK